MAEDTVSTMSFRDRLRGNNLFVEAVRQSDLLPRQKFWLAMLYRNPGVRADVDEYIEQLFAGQGDVNAMANGDIIKIILDRLPEIIAFIELLLKLFGGI